MTLRNLVVILGDQLDRNNAALEGFDPTLDRVWMAEVEGESNHVWSHKTRIALFLSAMRHFAQDLRALGFPILYRELGSHPHKQLDGALRADLNDLAPRAIVACEPGEWRVLKMLENVATNSGIPLELRPDTHFLIDTRTFDGWLQNRKAPRMEHFYRLMRKRSGILLKDGSPTGGKWNYDSDNRKTFGRKGPGLIPEPPRFAPDALTREVIREVERRFGDHPGELGDFNWPVTPEQARLALDDFVAHRLPHFGPFQDAMWSGTPFLYHSLLSSSLNLKLISPRKVLDAVVKAWHSRSAPIESVEGFVRQVLGWREYVRGLYWSQMPQYLEQNALGADLPLPVFYWTAETEMTCLREAVGQTLKYGYAHHIQRLMVTGLFALLLGVDPKKVHEWYLAIYVDAVEWVELPNTIGMSQYADGGLLASKPYVASGKYIKRMSNYCAHCRFDPDTTTGNSACPFTTLYWDFLIRHEERFATHPRTALQWRNLQRLDSDTRACIGAQAEGLRRDLYD